MIQIDAAVFHIILTEFTNSDKGHDGDGDPEQGPTRNGFPFAGRSIDLDQCLAETRTIQFFLFFQSQIFPISLFFFAQSLMD